jgi:hypothetical protein
MRRVLIILGCVALLAHAGSAAAQNDRGFGLGIMAGEPTGVSFKWWLKGTPQHAIDGGVAWSFTSNSTLHLHADYLLHSFELLKVEKGVLPLYYGIGARVRFMEDAKDDIGIRIPVGLEYLFPNSRFDAFVEVVPILDLAPATELGLNAAIGGRFFF